MMTLVSTECDYLNYIDQNNIENGCYSLSEFGDNDANMAQYFCVRWRTRAIRAQLPSEEHDRAH